MSTKHNKFTHGSGCFNCTRCGIRTRDTGQFQDGCDRNHPMCQKCYDMAGAENSVLDGHMSQEDFDAEFGAQMKKVDAYSATRKEAKKSLVKSAAKALPTATVSDAEMTAFLKKTLEHPETTEAQKAICLEVLAKLNPHVQGGWYVEGPLAAECAAEVAG